MYGHACTGEEIPLARRARYRWDFANAVGWSLRAVNRLMAASGGRGIFLDNPIQRAWRDVHAIQAHAADETPLLCTADEPLRPVDDAAVARFECAAAERRMQLEAEVAVIAAAARAFRSVDARHCVESDERIADRIHDGFRPTP